MLGGPIAATASEAGLSQPGAGRNLSVPPRSDRIWALSYSPVRLRMKRLVAALLRGGVGDGERMVLPQGKIDRRPVHAERIAPGGADRHHLARYAHQPESGKWLGRSETNQRLAIRRIGRVLLSAVAPSAGKKRPRSLPRRKTWVMLGVGGTTVTALAIALALSRRDEPTPVAVGDKATATSRTSVESPAKPTRTQAATKPLPPSLITQRWQRKWLRQH